MALSKDSISVIIPTLGKRTHLLSVITQLLNQSLDRSLYEIIVVDNGDGGSKNIVDQVNGQSGRGIIFLHDTVAGLTHARHTGVLHAKGGTVTFLDDDAIPVKDFLLAIYEQFKNRDVKLVGGKVTPRYESTPPLWMELFWKYGTDKYGNKWKICPFLSLVDLGNCVTRMNPKLAYGCNYSMRKDIFLELGGFNPDFVPENLKRFQGDGDSGLSYKVAEMGYLAMYEPMAEVIHIMPSSRFTIEYVKRRMFYSGISDSFSNARNYVTTRFTHKPDKPESRTLRAMRLLKDPAKFRHWITMKIVLSTSVGKRVNKLQQEYYKQGFEYHQSVLKNDPVVQEWVKRKSYLGVDYPETSSTKDEDAVLGYES